MTDKDQAISLSLLLHLGVILGAVFLGRDPVPEPALVVIDFSMAAVVAEAGQTPAQEKEQTSSDAPPIRSEPLVEQQDVLEKPTEQPADVPAKIIPKEILTREKSKKHLRPTVENEKDAPSLLVAEGQEYQRAPVAAENTPTEEADGGLSAGSETRIERSKGDSVPNKGYDFEFVRKLIVKNLTFPATARRKGLTGKIVVTFHLKEDGQATDIALVESSGHDILDNTVVVTIRRISPFPRPEAAAQIILPIVFHLK